MCLRSGRSRHLQPDGLVGLSDNMADSNKQRIMVNAACGSYTAKIQERMRERHEGDDASDVRPLTRTGSKKTKNCKNSFTFLFGVAADDGRRSLLHLSGQTIYIGRVVPLDEGQGGGVAVLQ